MTLVDPVSCPCLSGESYQICCGVFHRGDAAAPTALRLMRSRYAAFALGNRQYLLDTWHPLTRPAELDLDADQRWYRLDIIGFGMGGLLDTEGTVEFRAWFRAGGTASSQHEVSRFLREGGRWTYLQAV